MVVCHFPCTVQIWLLGFCIFRFPSGRLGILWPPSDPLLPARTWSAPFRISFSSWACGPFPAVSFWSSTRSSTRGRTRRLLDTRGIPCTRRMRSSLRSVYFSSLLFNSRGVSGNNIFIASESPRTAAVRARAHIHRIIGPLHECSEPGRILVVRLSREVLYSAGATEIAYLKQMCNYSNYSFL